MMKKTLIIFCVCLLGSSFAFGQTASDRFQLQATSNSNSMARTLSKNLREHAKWIQSAEKQVGKALIAEHFGKYVLDQVSQRLESAENSIDQISEEDAKAAISAAEESAKATGNPAAIRALRDIQSDARWHNDPKTQAKEILRSIHIVDIENALNSALKKFDGSVSRMVSEAARRIDRGKKDGPHWYQPFGLTRVLWDWATGPPPSSEGGPSGGFFGAFFGTPFTIIIDGVILPFSIIGYTCLWLGDLFSTSTAEEKLAEAKENARKREAALKKEIQDLKEKIQFMERVAGKSASESGAYKR